jgi:hypothetical protein
LLLRSKALAALALTAPLGSLAQGFRDSALLAGDQSKLTEFFFFARGFFAASVVAGDLPRECFAEERSISCSSPLFYSVLVLKLTFIRIESAYARMLLHV